MVIDLNDTHTHIKQRGNGELALVFLRYYGGSARTWDTVADELASRYRIVTTDHRGWGDSEAPVDHYGTADLAADAEGVIEVLSLRRYTLIDHPMRGKVARLVASRRPDGLKGPVLVASSPPSLMLLSDAQRTTLTDAYQARESVEFVVDHVLTVKPPNVAYREQVIKSSLKGAPQTKLAWPELATRKDITMATTSINASTIVISDELGQVDCIVTLQAELSLRIPYTAMHVLPGIRHLSPPKTSIEVTRIIGQSTAAVGNKSVTCRLPDGVSAVFDAALDAGDLDAMLGLFSN